MLEKNYEFKRVDERVVEKLIDDDNLALNHMIFTKGTGLPEHYSDSNVYMLVARGVLTLKLNDQESHKYSQGQIINIPYKVKMNVNNFDEEVLELFVIKAPNPKYYGDR
ncbi:cupin domain-containing protein [Clostridium swellfunianum]|uniref:cupin domain-containing protein n=1 Tax=Clostridium swellfunianum TaxID=1367462 RepID=UPI00203068ED|nr:cupin domain-containing protein [Clostridium swellfunianum]MCM0647587.1 cupin domain-containing protein [Clostridium swellfunianum]